MKKLMGEQLNHREIDEILRDVDLNGDGEVDFEGERIILKGKKAEGKKTEEIKKDKKKQGKAFAQTGTRNCFYVVFSLKNNGNILISAMIKSFP